MNGGNPPSRQSEIEKAGHPARDTPWRKPGFISPVICRVWSSDTRFPQIPAVVGLLKNHSTYHITPGSRLGIYGESCIFVAASERGSPLSADGDGRIERTPGPIRNLTSLTRLRRDPFSLVDGKRKWRFCGAAVSFISWAARSARSR